MDLKCIFSDNHLAFCQVNYLSPPDDGSDHLSSLSLRRRLINILSLRPRHGLLLLRAWPALASMTLTPVSAPRGVPGGPMMNAPGGGGAGGPGGRGLAVVGGRGLAVEGGRGRGRGVVGRPGPTGF